jgi:hypothetical protein
MIEAFDIDLWSGTAWIVQTKYLQGSKMFAGKVSTLQRSCSIIYEVYSFIVLFPCPQKYRFPLNTDEVTCMGSDPKL